MARFPVPATWANPEDCFLAHRREWCLADGMMIVAIILLVCGFVVGMLWLERGRQRAAAESLAAVAGRLNLELRIVQHAFGLQEASVEGHHQGKEVRFWAFTTGSGKSQRRWVAVGARPRQAVGFSFRIEPQGFGTKLAEFFGAREIQVGEPRFDAAWFVRTNAPGVFGAALVPEIREKMMRAREGGATGSYELKDEWVMYAEEGAFSKPNTAARLEALLPVVLDLADVTELCAGLRRT